MKKILALLSISAIFSLAAFAAVLDGKWSAEGSDKTAPKQLSMKLNGKNLYGDMDGRSITNGGVEGAFFWFHVVRNGVDFLYKGQIKAGKIELREAGPQGVRTLSFTPAR